MILKYLVQGRPAMKEEQIDQTEKSLNRQADVVHWSWTVGIKQSKLNTMGNSPVNFAWAEGPRLNQKRISSGDAIFMLNTVGTLIVTHNALFEVKVWKSFQVFFCWIRLQTREKTRTWPISSPTLGNARNAFCSASCMLHMPEYNSANKDKYYHNTRVGMHMLPPRKIIFLLWREQLTHCLPCYDSSD